VAGRSSLPRSGTPTCAAHAETSHIEAQLIADSPLKDGCGWLKPCACRPPAQSASYDKVTCEAAVALALWFEHDVQPVAQEMFGQRVASIQSFGSYSCRNIIGNSQWKNWRSEHATANAVDVGAFNLVDGRRISVAQHWKGDGVEARFLRAVRRAPAAISAWRSAPTTRGPPRPFPPRRGMLARCK
jgi:hypothetical protein